MRYLLVFIYILSMASDAKEIDLDKVQFTTVDELKKFQNPPPIPRPRFSPPRKREKYFEPPEFMAILKSNSLLVNIDTNKKTVTTKKVYVRAREEELGSANGFLLGKNNKPLYITNMTNLVSIQDDINLLAQPAKYKTYPPRNQLISNDKKLSLQNSIKFQQEFTSIGIIADALGINPTIATGQRLGLTTLYQSRLPFDFGITLNYQQASWNSISYWKALNIGPLIQIPLYTHFNNQLKGLIGYEQTLFFNLNSDQESIKISGGAILAELDYLFPTTFGTFMLGFSMRFLRAKISNAPYDLPTNDRKGINSYALTLGYSFDLEL